MKRLNREEGVMKVNLSFIKTGLLLVVITLILGVNESYFKDYNA